MQQRILTGLVFGGQIVWFSLMFTLLKVISQTCVPALEGMTASKKCGADNEVKFERPVLNALMMVGSMSLALIYFFGFLNGKKGVEPVSKRSLIFVLLPACLDTVTCALLMAGSMFIPISLTLTLKGIRILFSSVLVILIFKRKQKNYNWAGVGIAMLGVGLAALSAVLNNNASSNASASSNSTSMTIVGIGLVLASECFRSLMVVTQEYLIKIVKCDPSFMIGIQGVYGGILVVALMVVAWLAIPGSDMDDSFENLQTTFKLAAESPLITAILCVLPLFVVLGFVCSAMVTKYLSSVHNAMASVMMTALVWLIELFIHYVIDKHYGNPWGPFSVLQLVGFGFVILALLVYDGTFVKLTWFFEYPTTSVSQLKVIDDDISTTNEANCNKTVS